MPEYCNRYFSCLSSMKVLSDAHLEATKQVGIHNLARSRVQTYTLRQEYGEGINYNICTRSSCLTIYISIWIYSMQDSNRLITNV